MPDSIPRASVDDAIPLALRRRRSATPPHQPTTIGDVAESLRPPYSTFTTSQKRLIVALITFAATFSPLSSFIFFPAIDALSTSLKVSVAKINLTITSYMIVAGIAPAIVGDMADMTGRRSVYLLAMTIYCAANIGLAVQSTWTALFILRMLQGAGGAATIAIGYGVVSNIASPSERGGFVGTLLLGPNLATAIGPVLGGALAQHPGWRWIFWILAIASGTCLMLITRNLTFYTLFQLLQPKSSKCSDNDEENDQSTALSNGLSQKRFRMPNPLASVEILLAKDSILITLIYCIYYTNFSCLQASMSTLFIKLYGLSQLKAGLVYLPFGLASCLGAYCSGKLMNHDYRATAHDHGIMIDVIGGDNLTTFPIEKTRFRSIWYFIGVSGIATMGYGWSLHAKTHISIPLILQFLVGFSIAITFNICGTLLVDLHPKSPAAAQAANNIVRCSLASIGLGVLELLLNHLGIGWTFTLFGGMICVNSAELLSDGPTAVSY
ncbi:major facilitator superfamily domain-containing protein [Lophiotrema nucula]|uniref:Major facilitator superfamily domain-containing protein n=1 Tax=Lophiotrema nucula TaxID=690887 RepID=A0A6A5YR26_9PLEO|nr:major facilitator superfamily domain-containing protein [Lophiotrema nucula]